MAKHRLFFFTIAAVFMTVGTAFAQQPNAEVDEIENLFTREEETVAPITTAPVKPADQAKTPEAATVAPIKEVSDLSKLQPFKDVAVIQKRFLPKSKRFEFYIGPAFNLNDAFFFSVGADARFGFYFSERYGLEFTAIYLSTTSRQVTDNLQSRGVSTRSFVSPQGYYGVDFKWVPSYGKMTWANRRITPFDLYFLFGAGMTPTNQSKTEATGHLATGQIFALSKSSAVRWDLSWFMLTSTSEVDKSGNRSLYHNVLFSLGWSGFFPEATYR